MGHFFDAKRTLKPKSPRTSLGVARIFDWGAPNHKSHAMTSSETSKEDFFVGAKVA